MRTYWEEVAENTYCLFVEGEAYPFCTIVGEYNLGDCDSWVIASDYGEGFQEEIFGDLEDAKIVAKINMIELYKQEIEYYKNLIEGVENM